MIRTVMIKNLLLFLLILTAITTYAQQTPLYSQYFLNPYLYNPAAVGAEENAKAFLLYRKQWVGVTGAPETQTFTLDGKLRNHPVGLGLSVYNDINNVIGRTNFSVSSSYTILLANTQKLAFGMSVQGIQNKIFFDRIQADDLTDPNLLSSIDRRTAFEMTVGLFYSMDKLKIGFAVDQLLQREVRFENPAQFQALEFNLVRHYIGSAQYTFDLNNRFELEPLLLTRMVQGLPGYFDFNLLARYKKNIWISSAYRHAIGMAFSFGFELQNQMTIGYTYEVPTSDLSIIGSSSHEFVLGWRFGKSNSNQGQTTPKASNISQLEYENAKQYQEIDELKHRNDMARKELEESKRKQDEQQNEINQLREAMNQYSDDIIELIAQSNEEIEGLDVDAQGNFFLVVGAFKTIERSKLFQQNMKRENGQETRIIRNHQDSFYLIYTEQYDNLENALNGLKSIEETELIKSIRGNLWIYIRKEIDN
ncbi:MAG: type IX secretion system membrane protein PorP/SprF [Cytophagales bacterium]|nr:type IX secretion system membrane protein PorP/SprF [Cytophagales bacterium]